MANFWNQNFDRHPDPSGECILFCVIFFGLSKPEQGNLETGVCLLRFEKIMIPMIYTAEFGPDEAFLERSARDVKLEQLCPPDVPEIAYPAQQSSNSGREGVMLRTRSEMNSSGFHQAQLFTYVEFLAQS